ncbi:hypothetical protein DCAR_0622870 [Daucus carota subsp. sativus]|nr:hypothetical protein DCAR_0622870 [Daucus carota subsp. sativus]
MQDDHPVVVLARVAEEIQWPVTKDQATVKLDDLHYFFPVRATRECDDDDDLGDILNYGLTFASKGQEDVLENLDKVLESYCSFSRQKVKKKKKKGGEVLDVSVAKELSPSDLEVEKNKEVMEKRCQAYWTTLAPNVEDYSSIAAKVVASGSGQLVKGILWCGDVTVDRLKHGNEVLKMRMVRGGNTEISPETLKRIKRVKKVTKMTEKVAVGVLSGVLKVSGFFASSAADSKVGKKLFGILPGEMVLASLDGFNKVCDAFEVAGRNVMSTSNTVTTELVCHKYGEEAAKATNESLDAAGHAMGAAWTVFKIRKAINPKSVIRPSNLAKYSDPNFKDKKKDKKDKKKDKSHMLFFGTTN